VVVGDHVQREHAVDVIAGVRVGVSLAAQQIHLFKVKGYERQRGVEPVLRQHARRFQDSCDAAGVVIRARRVGRVVVRADDVDLASAGTDTRQRADDIVIGLPAVGERTERCLKPVTGKLVEDAGPGQVVLRAGRSPTVARVGVKQVVEVTAIRRLADLVDDVRNRLRKSSRVSREKRDQSDKQQYSSFHFRSLWLSTPLAQRFHERGGAVAEPAVELGRVFSKFLFHRFERLNFSPYRAGAHGHRAFAVENVGGHQRAVLGESPRQVFAVLSAAALRLRFIRRLV